MVVGHLVVGVDTHSLASLDVRVDRPALDRSWTHDRNLDRDVLERLGTGASQRLHLCPALDLKDAGRVRLLDALVRRRVVVGDPRQVDALVSRLRDHLHAALDRRQHPQPEQVDLQEAGVRAGVLVPLHDLASLHRRGHDRAAVDEWTGGDDHPARVLGEMAGKPVGLGRELGKPCPSAGGTATRVVQPRRAVGRGWPVRSAGRPRRRPGRGGAGRGGAGRGAWPVGRRWRTDPECALDVLCDLARVPPLAAACHALDLAGRQPERLAELPDRSARAICRERGDQRRAVVPVAVVDARDQHLPDVAREVEVDIGQRPELFVQKAADQQLVGDRIDVREAGEKADDRGHARAPAASGRQQCSGGVRSPHLGRNLARELEHVVMQHKEPGQAELLDDPQLLLQPCRGGVAHVPRRALVALVEPLLAQLRQVAHRFVVLRPRIPVSEIAGEVEAQAIGEPRRLRDRLRVLRKARRHRLRRRQHMTEVAAPLRL